MITEAKGNLLNAPVDALVNTVNTVGVMGKGIALQFKRAYPAMFKDYAAAAKRGNIAIGSMHVWHLDRLDGPRIIINFPTKSHWRSGSKLEDIESGLEDLVEVIRRERIASIAVPPLGCGNGGLDWSDVEPLVRRKLSVLHDVDIRMYPPTGAPSAAEMRTSEPTPRITPGRAALIELVRRYSALAIDGAAPIAVQKLMYFLQEAGEGLSLKYERNFYGPYADGLRAVLRDIEGHYLEGFGDGSQRIEISEPFRLLPGAAEAARGLLAGRPSTVERIDRVIDLTAGFESATSLELLATVHWVALHPSAVGRSDDEVVDGVRGWSKRKARLFTPGQIHKALDILRDKDWIPARVL
ncbi:macro domain-containing protein [Sanguibacter sp. 25GB23B1]|uniref:type II toxin-antitoxin system antitoxin DNA ADP-ribosyl glycohydrolase DarG n=1 Tax=unclassified Sanguibacter TaxID=2645534 RepID=UPI0032AFE004